MLSLTELSLKVKHGGARTSQLRCTLTDVASLRVSSDLKIMFPLGCFQKINSLSSLPLPRNPSVFEITPRSEKVIRMA